MSARLTVIFYIILCLEAGIVLTFLPWMHPFGLGDWADNFFLVYAVQKTGLQGLQHAVASGWVRGAVTGLGLLNLGMAGWEIAHFRQTVNSLRGHARRFEAESHADGNPPASQLPDHERRDDARDQSAV